MLAAAKRLFVDRGFGGTSLRDIAAEAGYTQGAFYSNFASKEELFVELMRERSQTQVADIARVLSDPDASGEDILTALEVWSRTVDAGSEWSVLGVEFKLQGRRNPAFAVASQALLDAHRDGLAYCIEQIFARLKKVPPGSPAVLPLRSWGLAGPVAAAVDPVRGADRAHDHGVPAQPAGHGRTGALNEKAAGDREMTGAATESDRA